MRRKNSRERQLVDPRFAKSKRYGRIIREIEGVGVCPFCPKTFKWHTKPILRTTSQWLITENFAPYKNTVRHLIIVGKRHREHIAQLTPRDWKEISSLINWAVKKFKIRGGGLAMRFGDTLHTGATVVHLHLHLIVPRVKKGKAQPVLFPFG